MGAIFQVNENDLPWTVYEGTDGEPAIRVKALTIGANGVPPMQYVEYGPGHTDPVHSHSTGEFFIVTDGALWLDDVKTGPRGVVFIGANTEYSVRAGDEGARYFRIVV